jgi:hypothetical protein
MRDISRLEVVVSPLDLVHFTDLAFLKKGVGDIIQQDKSFQLVMTNVELNSEVRDNDG